ncbi:MAG: DUF4351 domain-containing protein [bacterium]
MEETAVGKELIRIGVRRGVPQGMHRLLLQQIAYRFGRVPNTVRQQIEKISDAEELERIAKGLFEAKDLKQLKMIIGPNGKPSSLHGSGLNGKRKKDI